MEKLMEACEQAQQRRLARRARAKEKMLIRKDYIRVPVPIRQFIHDDRYLGKVLKNSIFPKLADDLEEFFDGGCSEALLTGGIGWGKPRFAEIAIAYDIYQVSRQGRQRSCPTMIRRNVNAGSPVSILDVLPMRLWYG